MFTSGFHRIAFLFIGCAVVWAYVLREWLARRGSTPPPGVTEIADEEHRKQTEGGEGFLAAIAEALAPGAIYDAAKKATLITCAVLVASTGVLIFYWAFGLWYGWIAVVVLACLAGWVMYAYGLWRQWLTAGVLPELHSEPSRLLRALISSYVAIMVVRGLIVLLALFAALTAAFQREGWVTEKPAVPSDETGSFVWTALGYYVWNLLNAVPALEIPETLNWDTPPTELTDHLGGTILLTFKLIVIVPLVGLVLDLIRVWTTAKEPDAAAAKTGRA